MKSRMFYWMFFLLEITFITSCSNNNVPDKIKEMDVVNIRIYEVETGDIERSIQLSGEVAAQDVVKITPDTSGLLTEILVTPGDYVEYDQIIAWVDPSRPGLSYSVSPVRSKLAGTVTNVPGMAGNQVSPQVIIAEVGDLENLEITCKVPETSLSYLYTGLQADITSRAYPDDITQAQISEISPVVDPISRTIRITLIPESNRNIRPGQSVMVQLILDTHKNAILIPETSITERYGEMGVYIINNEIAEWRMIKLGLRQYGYVEILEGLDAGDIVAAAGVTNLTDGISVLVLKD